MCASLHVYKLVPAKIPRVHGYISPVAYQALVISELDALCVYTYNDAFSTILGIVVLTLVVKFGIAIYLVHCVGDVHCIGVSMCA